MAFFKKRLHKTGTRRLTEEQKKRKEDFRLSKVTRRLIHAEYVKKLESDPNIMRQAMADTYNLNIKTIDPAEQKKRQFQDKVAERLLNLLESDEEFSKEVIEAEKQKMIEEYTSSKDYSFGDGHFGSDFEEQLDMMDRLKDRFGGGGTFANVVEMVKAVAPMLPALLPKLAEMQQAQLQAQQAQQLQMGEVQTHPQLGTMAPLVIAPPETETEPIKPPPEKPPEAPPKAPTEPTLNISTWAEYLDGEPEAFVAELNRLHNEGDLEATFVLEVLWQKEAYEILEMLQPLKDNEELGKIVTKLEDQEWWLVSVIELVRAEEPLNLDIGEG